MSKLVSIESVPVQFIYCILPAKSVHYIITAYNFGTDLERGLNIKFAAEKYRCSLRQAYCYRKFWIKFKEELKKIVTE